MITPTLYRHTPVLLRESIEALRIQPGGLYIDCTAGDGGHASAILERCGPGGKLLGIDADPEAIAVATVRLRPYDSAVTLVNDNFRNLGEIAGRHGFDQVHGILFDLGLSSLQIEEAKRGFSFQRDSPLDMRYHPAQALTAADIVNSYSEGELADLIYRYSEEPRSRRIARFIVKNRPVVSSSQLAQLVEKAVGAARGKIHPATRTFQALRVAVNKEMENLEIALRQAVKLLRASGRLVIISFHSLEDRLVKTFLHQECQDCLCPPRAPLCVCGHSATLRLINKRVIVPSETETQANPRSRSARMRVAERL